MEQQFEEFAVNMDAFLNDLRGFSVDASSIMLMSMLHHLWTNHPLKLSTGVTLVALSYDMVFDASNVQSIKKDREGDYCISFKSGGVMNPLYVYNNTPEYLALEVFIHSLSKRAEEEEH